MPRFGSIPRIGVAVIVGVSETGVAVPVGGIEVDVALVGIRVDGTPQADNTKPKNDVPLNLRKSRRERCLNFGSCIVNLL
jgi:hypothetical protein